MARIKIEDLKIPEQTLTVKEMGAVVGGFSFSISTPAGSRSWSESRNVGHKWVTQYKATQVKVAVHQTRQNVTNWGTCFGAWR